MGLETGTEIQDLNPNWPLGTDDVSQGDDHIRLVKSCIQGSFPGTTAPWTAAGQDLVMRDGQFRTVTITDEILSNAQVAIAATTVNGVTGAITGPNFGFSAVQRISSGVYEMQLTETAWATVQDLQFGLMAHGGLGGFYVWAVTEATTNPSSSWIKISTAQAVNPGVTLDCALFHIVVFDAGRD